MDIPSLAFTHRTEVLTPSAQPLPHRLLPRRSVAEARRGQQARFRRLHHDTSVRRSYIGRRNGPIDPSEAAKTRMMFGKPEQVQDIVDGVLFLSCDASA